MAAPATDGGYVLIATCHLCPHLFARHPRSTAEVLAVTRRRAAEFGLTWRKLSTWEDVDDFPSLLGLLQRSPPTASAAFVRRRLAHLLPARSLTGQQPFRLQIPQAAVEGFPLRIVDQMHPAADVHQALAPRAFAQTAQGRGHERVAPADPLVAATAGEKIPCHPGQGMLFDQGRARR